MRHSVFGRKLSRTKNERRRLFWGLLRDLVLRGKIETTKAKAKAVQPLIEKLITKAKKGTGAARRIERIIPDKKVVKSLLDQAATRFAKRTSGYTRIVKLGSRLGDNTETVFLEFVDEEVRVEQLTPRKAVAEEKKILSQPREKSSAMAKKRGRPKKSV